MFVMTKGVKGEGGGGRGVGMERRGIGSGDTLRWLACGRVCDPPHFPICVTLSNLFIGLNQLLLRVSEITPHFTSAFTSALLK